MGLTCILTEKPSVAKTLANFLGAKKRCDGYFEGNGYIITFAFGHLLELYDAKDYDSNMEKWELYKFPFIPEKFKYRIKTNGKTKKTDSGAKKQFYIIKQLVNRKDVTQVITATDYDREGEVIGSILFDAIGVSKPHKRILVNEWTPEDIKRGLDHLKDISEMKPLQDAGQARQLADWLIGINFTSCATLQFLRGKGVLNVGRVLMPTLKLIYDRDVEIHDFTPQKYFELKCTFRGEKGQYPGLLVEGKNTRFENQGEIQKLQKALIGKKGNIQEKTVDKKKQFPPKLFNLPDLQGYMSSKYKGWTSDKVKKVAQSLYEGKGSGGYISYPRTKSRVLEETLIDKIRRVLEKLKEGLPYEEDIKFHTAKRVFDTKKVDGHSAITPTHIKPSQLSKDEKLLYDVIVKRFIAQFMPPAIYEHTEMKTKVDTEMGEKHFITKGKILLEEGWLKVYGKEANEEEGLLPWVEKGESIMTEDAELVAKETQPPARHTEKTLLKAMETCGKNLKKKNEQLQEEELEEILDGYEIGTPATRDETIVKLINTKYIERQGKSLGVTPKGIKLIETFPVKEILDVNYTGRLEKALSEIEKGNFPKERFMNHIIQFVKKGVEDIKNTNVIVADQSKGEILKKGAEILGKCPSCGREVVENSKAFGCVGYREGCKFALWKNDKLLASFKKKPTKTMVKSLLKNQRTTLKGLQSKSGKKFDCDVEMYEGDKGYWNFHLIFNKDEMQEDKNVEILGKCPACTGDVIESRKGFECSKKDCTFILWKEDIFLKKFHKEMTKEFAQVFLRDGKAYVENLYSSKKQTNFNATLALQKNGQYWGYKFESFGSKSKNNKN